MFKRNKQKLRRSFNELLLEDIGVLCRSGKSQMDRRWAGAVVLQSLLYLPLNFLRHILLKLWILYPILYM